jgi:hypothetical protein
LTSAPHPIRRCIYVATVCAAWAVISVHPLMKYLSHTRALAALVFGLLSILVAMLLPDPFHLRQRRLHAGWFLLLFLLLGQAFAVLYPISLRHTLNRGSDREDALRIELRAVTHHEYPYAARTFLGNPPTPLPGAMLLAAPFYAVGHIAWQNFLWLALFFVFAARFFRYRATALFFLATFLLFAPADLSDFTSGGDYLTNFFYVAIAATLFARSLHRPLAVALASAVFLGITLSSRALYPLILIPLLAYTLQRTPNARARTLAMFAVALAAAAAITLPIFAPHPVSRLLAVVSQNSDKLRFLPAALHPRITLPLLALATASTAFFVRMDLPRLFLIFGAASLVILAPSIATFGLHSGYAFFYLSVCSLSFSLWALARYETQPHIGPPPPSNHPH